MFTQEVTSQVELFRNCSQDFVKALLTYIETRVYSTADVTFRHDGEGDCMFLLQKGQVEMTKDGFCVTTLKSGDVFGGIATLSTGSRGKGCTIIAAITMCDCRVIRQGVLRFRLIHFPANRETEVSLPKAAATCQGIPGTSAAKHVNFTNSATPNC